ncbi:hypothetical protein O6H91_04G107000 [Diphasiastrum complanatum]|uniref:Uncharacterized protein n=1 Tax=Diphasiastrum complanatum TaxID=34168 RepID=A0ACC2E0K7_DIPCM|nr:hypothetical protein O6H91_04G107000 [Diphasiastrum complanatum]
MADAGIRHSWSWGMPPLGSIKSFDVDQDMAENDLIGVRSEPSSVADSIKKFSSLASVKDGPTPEKLKLRTQPAAIDTKVLTLRERVTTARNECLELRQEASDLQEYCNAKIARVTRYLGVLAEKARKLDQVAVDCEERLTPLQKEKKKLFNDLVSIKGNIRVFVRVRPPFEHEGHTITSFPDDFTIRISSSVSSAGGANAVRKEFEFDRVYGPHVGQGELFEDVQPLVQSALDGYNVAVFAYGQTGAGKTHTMEGPSQDRGLYFRTFDKLFELADSDSTAVARYTIFLTLFELHNEQIRDLLRTSTSEHHKGFSTVQMGYGSQFVELVELRVDNSLDFARAFKMGMQNRAVDAVKTERASRSHLVLTAHVQFFSSISGIKQYSKLSLVDMAGSERLSSSEAGNRLTESLHVHKSLSALGDVVSSLTAKKEHIPYGNSKLTQILSDSLGGNSKTLIIVNLSPSYADMQETLSSLNFAARARNVELSLGSRDTIKKWRDVANEARKEVLEKEKEVSGLQQEVFNLKKTLKESEDQCLLLFNEVQKAWKVTFDLQADLGAQESHINKLKIECSASVEKERVEKEHNLQLQMQFAQLAKIEKDQKAELFARAEKIQALEELQQLLAEVQGVSKAGLDTASATERGDTTEIQMSKQESESASAVNKKLEEELSKRDELIERLHEENEKLFERLTDRNSSVGSPKISRRKFSGMDDIDLDASFRSQNKPLSPERKSTIQADPISGMAAPAGTVAVIAGSEKVKTTPAGEYLTAALMDFNPEQYDGPAAVADGANKLLMLVLAAVIKAGAVREHEMLAEIRGAVFSFIRKMEPRKVMDTMLVSRVRILYIRSLLSRASELQAIKVPPVERFLEKAGSGRSRSSSRGSSPLRSPVSAQHEANMRKDFIDDNFLTFKVHLKQEKKSKFSSIVLKLRGIDQETWRQHVTGAKLRETSEEARSFAVGNKKLASLFVHTPAGELQRQIRGWLAENFDFFSLTGGESIGGVAGHLELLSTAIMDGWMAGLGTPARPSTDALGQLLAEYTKRVYTSQLQHLKDLSATLATEEAEDLLQITKLRSALESVEHKRRKILQQMRTDVALLTKEEGGSPLRNPSTATEDARVASLISLEDIVRQAEEIQREAQQKPGFASKRKGFLTRLSELSNKMPTLLSIDHPCAQKFITETRKLIESLPEQRDEPHHSRTRSLSDESFAPAESSPSYSGGDGIDVGVQQWSILQFNNGTESPFVIKCGATLSSELVVKAHAKLENSSSKEIVATAPLPSSLSGLSLEGIKKQLSSLPEPLIQLALAKTADGTRARYARLYKTLASRVPALRESSNY